jgi:homocysteine S-methyltransferase
LANDEVILIDGATGTELELLGAPMVDDAWCAMATVTDPEAVRAVHMAHIEAGAELIIANTFASSRHVLERAGHGDRFEELNTLSIELARQARDAVAAATGQAPVPVAGSISTTQQGGAFPPLEVSRVNFADQVRLQAEAGADLFILEMMRELDQTQAILDAIYDIGLPAWVGWSCVIDDGEVWLWNQEHRLVDALAAVKGQPIDVVAVMHTEVHDIDPCLDVLAAHWDGPLGVYAHTGYFEQPNWVFHDTISREDHTDACLSWVERGVQVIGGCCGIGPDHIRHLRDRLPLKLPG